MASSESSMVNSFQEKSNVQNIYVSSIAQPSLRQKLLKNFELPQSKTCRCYSKAENLCLTHQQYICKSCLSQHKQRCNVLVMDDLKSSTDKMFNKFIKQLEETLNIGKSVLIEIQQILDILKNTKQNEYAIQEQIELKIIVKEIFLKYENSFIQVFNYLLKEIKSLEQQSEKLEQYSLFIKDEVNAKKDFCKICEIYQQFENIAQELFERTERPLLLFDLIPIEKLFGSASPGNFLDKQKSIKKIIEDDLNHIRSSFLGIV